MTGIPPNHRQAARAFALIALALYLTSVALIPFAHRAAAPAAPSAAELTAYALPDGTLPLICFGGRTTDGDGPPAYRRCEACIVTAACGLVPVSATPRPQRFALPIKRRVPQSGATTLRRLAAKRWARAPPA